jgi:hypothetical protein
MKQFVKQFHNLDNRMDDVINDYLEEHPGYLIDKIFLLGNGDFSDYVLVVFNVEKEQFRTHE